MKRSFVARPADLLSVDEAQRRILSRFARLEPETIPLSESLGRVLAKPILADMHLPPFANSSMDGFALVSTDTEHATQDEPVLLSVTDRIPAGSAVIVRISPGRSARIMTGAPLPTGANAVIPFELVEERDGAIAVFARVQSGACVRPAGQDVRPGQSALEPGTVMHAPQIGLTAALGHRVVIVTRRPRVAILSTGDELVDPGTPLSPGQIYNSNTPMLGAAVTEAGGISLSLPSAGDDPTTIASILEGAGNCDLLLTSGGASVGDFDHVKDVLGRGGEISFWRVRVRPGKPLIFGSLSGTPVIGLPGNPTSAMVTFEEFVRPAIGTMLGTRPFRTEIDVVLDERIDNGGGRRTYARVRLSYRDGAFHARLAGDQDSAKLLPLSQADGLLIISEDRAEMNPGEKATVQVWHLPK